MGAYEEHECVRHWLKRSLIKVEANNVSNYQHQYGKYKKKQK